MSHHPRWSNRATKRPKASRERKLPEFVRKTPGAYAPGSPQVESRLRLNVLQHFLARHQTMPPAFVDVQRLEQATAQLALHLLDSVGGRAQKRNRTAGATIMTTGATELAHHLTQHFACSRVLRRAAHRQHQLVVEHASADCPVDFLESNQEINYLGRQLRLRQFVDPADNQPVVNERTLQCLQDALKMALRQPSVANARQQILRCQWIQIQ